jgi:hypothetical protein
MMAESGLPATRDMASLKNYFKEINPAVLAFKAYHKQAMKQVVSVWNEEMYERHALQMWENDEGGPYLLIDCCRILQELPKYVPSKRKMTSFSCQLMFLWVAI